MNDQSAALAILEASATRRDQRRHFLKLAGGAAAVAGAASAMSFIGSSDQATRGRSGGVSATAGGSASSATGAASSATATSPVAAAISDADVLNFALNLEYLEAEFYSYAVLGKGLQTDMIAGTGKRGTTTGGRKVNFTAPVVAQYAAEIARDEIAHVAFLRKALGSSAVARPTLNIGGDANGAFTAAARAAGVVPADGTFDPYASDENFLLGAFIFEDVGVTAYKGAAPLLTNATYVEASAGILAAEAYHAGLIRTLLYGKGLQAPTLIDTAGKISDARDSLDGPDDIDQPIVDGRGANIVPTDSNGLAFSRTTGQVLNIVYLNSASVVGGGFFPRGVNGAIQASAANS